MGHFRIAAAGERPRLIDGAVALLRVEELADAAKMRIGLAAHGHLFVFARHGVFLFRFADAEAEIVRKPLHVALVQRNDGIGTAIARTLGAIVGLAHRLTLAHRITQKRIRAFSIEWHAGMHEPFRWTFADFLSWWDLRS